MKGSRLSYQGVATVLPRARNCLIKGSQLSYRSAESFAGDGLTVPIVRTLIDLGTPHPTGVPRS